MCSHEKEVDMKKSRLLCGVIATMSLGAVGAISVAPKATEALTPDTRVIVKLSKDIEDLTVEEAEASQQNLLSRIRYSVNPNAEFLGSYNVLNNAINLKVNSSDIEKIEKLSGVEKVYKDHMRVKQSNSKGITYKVKKDSSSTPEIDPNENVSARTMRKPGYDDGTGNKLPGVTREGEGTVVAILDNEFYFRAKTNTSEAWHHEVFDPLPEDVKVRFDEKHNNQIQFRSSSNKRALYAVFGDSGMRPVKLDQPGREGSLYFNSKVPFYFDYGGSIEKLSTDDITPDFDVHSDIDYHGSHVASITAANATGDTATFGETATEYKGIAPYAQLACMKVFSEFKADDIAKSMGFSDASYCFDSCILHALEDCRKLRVDGINMSLGSDLDEFSDDDLAMETIHKMVEEDGILTSISNGNDGKESYAFAGGYGNWTNEMVETGILGSYANNEYSMSIGSAHPDYIYYKTGIKIGEKTIAYDDQIVNNERYPSEYKEDIKMHDKLGSGSSYVYVPGFGTSNDYKGLDVEGKVAVVNRGSSSFADKYATAVDKGAIGLFIINNDPTETDFTFRCSFGDDFNPTIPCAVILFKDKPYFESNTQSEFVFVEKELAKDEAARTMSTFSTDGARSDLKIKPEITAPGDIVRGAVPPQTKEDKADTPLTTYEYLSGTSMSAPNYAGAQALVLSEKISSKSIREHDGVIDDKIYKDRTTGEETNSEQWDEIVAERRKVDMRLMSTANPMNIVDPNPETNKVNYASPRVQGAGMVDLYGALNSKVYLEGFETVDGEEKGLGRAKIELGNNDDINKGKLKLSFYAHNESENSLSYKVKLTVMRPAQASNNEIITSDYNYLGEVDSFEKLPGIQYYDYSYRRVVYTSGTASYKDCYKVTKELTYYRTQADYEAKTNPVVIPVGKYYVSSQVENAVEGVVYSELPKHKYLSTKDIVLEVVQKQTVTIPSGDSKVVIDEYSLSEKDKQAILEAYPYGTYIEGFVELLSKGFEEDLSIPFLGFYGGGDKIEGQDYNSAPVVEEFQFEKNPGQVYPSDLVNDAAKSLMGKDYADTSSLWMVGYSKSPDDISVEKILTNDKNVKQLTGFYPAGTDPLTGSDEEAKNTIYVGNAEMTNTMIIQQFVLRSVADNYFTITNKKSGEVVYKSAMEDIYGDTNGLFNLYKSHINFGYYFAHRALAVVPLYNETTHERFADGEYEIEFNYLLNGTQKWVSKSYNLVIDNEPAVITSVYEYNGQVRIEMKDAGLSYLTIGYTKVPVNYDEAKTIEKNDGYKYYYVDVMKSLIESSMNELGRTEDGTYRLYLSPVDKAYGSSGVIVHFTKKGSYNEMTFVQNRYLKSNNDFRIDANGNVSFIEIDQYGNENLTSLKGVIVIASNSANKPAAYTVAGSLSASELASLEKQYNVTVLSNDNSPIVYSLKTPTNETSEVGTAIAIAIAALVLISGCIAITFVVRRKHAKKH